MDIQTKEVIMSSEINVINRKGQLVPFEIAKVRDKIKYLISYPKAINVSDNEIEELRKKIRELEEKKVSNKKTFIRLPIERNLELLKNLFADIIQDDGFLCGGFSRVCISKNSDVIPLSIG